MEVMKLKIEVLLEKIGYQKINWNMILLCISLLQLHLYSFFNLLYYQNQ